MAHMYRETNGWIESMLDDESEETEEVRELARELRRRIRILYGQLIGWTGNPSADQKAQIRFLADAKEQIAARIP